MIMNMNKKAKYFLLIGLMFLPSIVFAAPYEGVGENFCTDIQETLVVLGYILFILKLLVPLIIILLGTVNYYKAVIGDKDDEIKKQAVKLGKKIILGLLIFLLPTIINIVMDFVDKTTDYENSYSECLNCVLNPGDCAN